MNKKKNWKIYLGICLLLLVLTLHILMALRFYDRVKHLNLPRFYILQSE